MKTIELIGGMIGKLRVLLCCVYDIMMLFIFVDVIKMIIFHQNRLTPACIMDTNMSSYL
jgi:hypothetical protein